jgi:site-specific DNA-methyltransferase (adenine-specific)
MDIEKSLNKRDGVEFKSKPASGVGFMNTNDDGYHNTINQLEQIGESSERAKKWQGWGTCLKPSFEPIIVARKPFKGSIVDNVIEYGVGGINIDECRVAFNGDKWKNQKSGVSSRAYQSEETTTAGGMCEANDNGRFPANTILTYDETPSDDRLRYFYCAKASKKDRDEGLDTFEEKVDCDRKEECYSADVPFNRSANARKNIHPTVKPTELMQYLVRLVTPNGGTILDPFNGSGSTGKAVMYENKEKHKSYKYIGIELTEEYLPIAQARIEYVCNLEEEKPDKEQLSLFD